MHPKKYFDVKYPLDLASQNSHCLKITQNVSYEFSLILAFPPIFVLLKLTCLVKQYDRFSFSKTRQNGPFLAFLINFCPLKK